MHKDIIKRSIQHMSSDANIIRITFLTSFFHSLIVTLLLILHTNKLFVNHYENGLYIGKIAEFLIWEINKNHVVAWVIGITIVLFFFYSFVYPIGQAAVIHYLHWQKSIRHSLKAAMNYFFPMFEYGFVSLVFSPISLFISAYKVFLLDNVTSLRVVSLFLIWFILMVLINTLKIYTRYFIVLQQMWVSDAIKASFITVFGSFKETYRYMKMQTLLLINFSLNIVLIIGIPILLMYLSISWGIINFWWVKSLVYLVFFLLVIFGAYMSSFIRAFFAYYWYEMYNKIKK